MDDTSNKIFKDCVEGLVNNVFKVRTLLVLAYPDLWICTVLWSHRKMNDRDVSAHEQYGLRLEWSAFLALCERHPTPSTRSPSRSV